MRIIDDGHVAISIEIHGGKIRMHPSVPEDGDSLPPVIGVGNFHEVTAEVVMMSGFKAAGITPKHVRLRPFAAIAVSLCSVFCAPLTSRYLQR